MIRAKVGELNEIIIDAQERVFAVNEERSTLMDRVGLLEGEVARFEDWDSEKQRYQLTDFGSGTFAYSLKTDQVGQEPAHRICANCYQKREKSILQFDVRANGRDHYDCPSCGTKFMFGELNPPQLPNRSNRGSAWTS